jgi:hypothetical protein
MYRHFSLRNIGLFFCALAIASAPVLVFAQQAGDVVTSGAVLSFNPPSGTIGVGKTLTIVVAIDSPKPYNSGSALINFDKGVLSVESISKNNSAFSLWAVEPSFVNAEGKLNFEGGSASPLSGKKTVLTFTLKGLKEGKSDVTFTTGSVLAADGKGTDILSTKTIASYDVKAGAAENNPPPQPSPSQDPGGLGPKPEAPDVTATSHPDENLYYNAPKARFLWELPPDVTVDRLVLDTSEKTDPKTNYDPALNEKEFDQLTDGVMYFHIKYKNDAGWGPVTHKKILVDKTPPPPFTLDISVPASSTDAHFKFSATDTLSGLDRYEAVIDAGNPIKITLADAKSGEYVLAGQSYGEHSVTLKAFDKAGNYTGVDAKFTIEGEPPKPAAAAAATDDTPKPTNWSLIANIFLVALVAFLIGYLLYERKAFRREKYVAKREADELRDSLANIFAALREEVGEQTGLLFERPNPSAQDREIMETINEAIDLSEELISKEAEDVRKLLL